MMFVKTYSILGILILYVTITLAFQPDIVEYDGHLTIKLQHALDQVQEPQFFDRGTVQIQSIRTGAVTLQQPPLSADDKHKLKTAAQTLEWNLFLYTTSSFKEKWKNLDPSRELCDILLKAEEIAERDGLYRLRAFVRTLDGKESSFLTFVKACSIIESHLSDILTVSLDHTGSVIAVSMSTSPAVCEGQHITEENLRHFNTTVFVKHMEQGPVPDTAAYIQKLEKEREARERGETKDNRSFLAKYWMYIVPVVIFVVLSGAANPEGGAGAGGGGAGR